jgi:DNA-directed RNA polymerase subunit RPC12/RpoP
MKEDYNRSIKLRCITCGDDSSFESNEDKTYIKCIRCGREYLGGYDEVVELNQELIDQELEDVKREVVADLKRDFNKSLKDVFKGNKL